MSKIGIAAYGTTSFTKDDQKIETILHKSTNDLFQKNPNIDKKEIDAVLVSTNNNSKYLSPILSEMEFTISNFVITSILKRCLNVLILLQIYSLFI